MSITVIILFYWENMKQQKIEKNVLQPSDVETTRDYAERLSFELNNKIMSQHFGNNLSLSIEGASVSFF